MDSAQNSFISSTFWTERIGYAAALATLKKIKENKVYEKLTYYGELINQGWERIAKKNGLDIEISGIPPLTHISFKAPNALEVQTLYAQEMLGRGYLLGAAVYTTFAYTDAIIEQFIDDSDKVFAVIKMALDEGSVKKQLKGDVIQAGFKRLT